MSDKPQHDLRSQTAGAVLREWWLRMNEDRPGRPMRRGDRAKLQRCHSFIDVALDESFYNLLFGLEKKKILIAEEDRHRLAAVVMVLVRVRSEAKDHSLGRLMARPDKEGKKGSAVSDLRFRRLLKIDSLGELVSGLISVVSLLNERVHLISLANDIFEWADPELREDVRQRWAYDYYSTAKIAD